MAIYVVGDIQGCYEPLCRLLEKVKFDPATDQLWSAGDMINRGPHSLNTLRFLRSLGPAFAAVLGNHDLHFLATACGAYTEGNTRYLRELLDAPDCSELFEWVRTHPLARRATVNTEHGVRKILLVHAGISPGWKFRKTIARSAEVETVLRGPAYRDYLAGMYGNKPDTWDKQLAGIDRLRVITNVLTRIRFCTPSGELNLTVKTGAETAPAGFRPWYEYQQLKPGRMILFGHWATLHGHTGRPDIQALDTGCVWGRCLTALNVETNERFSIDCSQDNF
jgi:bis(5'-nucleosyl)-tetraphosphatase (symmetrical)